MGNAEPFLSTLNYIPADIQCAEDYEHFAKKFIPEPIYEYIAGGSGQDLTLSDNRKAFLNWNIYPRILRNVTFGHTRARLAGTEFPHPIFLAPVAFQTLVHPLGELETARAAEVMQACMVSSTLSSNSLEDIASAAGSHKWFQLYFQPNRQVTLDLIKRAKLAGYSAIVFTVDAPIRAPNLKSLHAQFTMPDHCVAANFVGYSLDNELDDSLKNGNRIEQGKSRILNNLMLKAPTWSDLEWLMTHSCLPIWVKGVLHFEDAVALKNIGVNGIIVSNHGGRTLDGVPASLHCLTKIRAAVGENYPLLFDGGIRSGLDIFKAIALGADAVLVGRLQIYALSVAGALGVAHMLRLLCEELEVCMALAGCATLADIRKTTLEAKK